MIAGPALVWFIDRSLGKRVCEALRATGEVVVYLEDDYADTASDEQWLAEVGAKGYVVITKDKQIRTRLVERQALLHGSVRAFFLTSGNLTGLEMAEILTAQLSTMARLARSSPPPFLATVTRTEVRLLKPQGQR